jgi:hypothetical protein
VGPGLLVLLVVEEEGTHVPLLGVEGGIHVLLLVVEECTLGPSIGKKTKLLELVVFGF